MIISLEPRYASYERIEVKLRLISKPAVYVELHAIRNLVDFASGDVFDYVPFWMTE
jgi:hypothetical protein